MSVAKGFKNRMAAITLSIYVVFLGYMFVAVTPTGLFWFMALSCVVMSFFLPIANVSTQTIIQTTVPMKIQGRVNSVITTLASAATPAAQIIAGPVASLTGTANLFLVCAGLGIAVLTAAWLFTDFKLVDKSNVPQSELNGIVDVTK